MQRGKSQVMERIKFRPIWFDSMGAKSSCTLVGTPDIKIVIDPGVASMQPSFPASDEQKLNWYNQAYREIRKASKNVDVIVISHYHYDHFTDFEKEIYTGKTLLAKNPNSYINGSQSSRSERFYSHFCKEFGEIDLKDKLEEPHKTDYRDPMDELPLARRKDFGDYTRRKQELLEKGRIWFKRRADRWNSIQLIPELDFNHEKVRWIDGREFEFGKTTLRFTKPFFHGIEFSRVGWVCSMVVERNGEKFIHSSDLMGPAIEDYAQWIIEENPDVLIMDGPATYMVPYATNLINLKRCVDNMVSIVSSCHPELILYDHHLLRDKHFKERTRKIWEKAGERKTNFMTVAEFLGLKPAVLSI
jgi:hypothetical protein